MSKEPRYLAQPSEKEDKDFIDNSFSFFIALNTGLVFKYPNPNDLALKFHKLTKLRKTNLNLYSVLFMVNELEDSFIKPAHLLRYLSDKTDLPPDVRDDSINSSDSYTPINSSILRDSVLKNFEKSGYLQHIQGKENIEKLIQKKRGRKSSIEDFDKREGNPSIYKVSSKFEHFRRIIKKPVCIDYLFNKFENDKLCIEFMKYYLEFEYYLAKLDESIYLQMLDFKVNLSKEQLPSDKNKPLKAFLSNFENIEPKEVDKIIAEMVLMNKEYLCLCILLLGLNTFD